ncbi:hypothetical protein KTAU_40430 [Thermogemmatispora aurantia]|uniref:Uncharacterized protein n=1 Tax=Thermogemmatispora aurantia TaxID=2045279 RepID=A0A5J4KA06_9CHLR|nr:hypothetical protein KTAU_40430 [Thermogemmatispora aurantia]
MAQRAGAWAYSRAHADKERSSATPAKLHEPVSGPICLRARIGKPPHITNQSVEESELVD